MSWLDESPVPSSLPGILVWGAGSHAAVVADIIRKRERFRIAGFLDDVTADATTVDLVGAPLFRSTDCLGELRSAGVEHVAVAIGDCVGRLRCAAIAGEHGYTFPTQIHPQSVIASGSRLGAGCVMAPGAILGPGVELGEHVIVNTGSTIDHETVLSDGVHVSAGVCVGGRVRIQRAAFVGMGATVLTDVTIGEGAYVGAGALVLDDVPPHALVYGVPARVRGSSRDV